MWYIMCLLQIQVQQISSETANYLDNVKLCIDISFTME